MASTKTLSGGIVLPTSGFGTWNFFENTPAMTEAVKTAIDQGYRIIDTAWAYENEKEVGAGVNAKIQDGTVRREELIVCSKLWNSEHRKDLVKPAVQECLKSMALDYIDIYYIHWPVAFKENAGPRPKDDEGKLIMSDTDYVETYQALEECVDEGLIRNIGLSNFNHRQVQRVVANSRIKPLVNQLEIHPYLTNTQLVDFCHSQGVQVIAYSPFGAKLRPWKQDTDPVVLEDPIITAIAQRVQRTTAQVVLRYLLQRDLIVLTRSSSAARMKENIQVYDFELLDDDMAQINSLNKNFRAYKLEWWEHSQYWPFHEDY